MLFKFEVYSEKNILFEKGFENVNKTGKFYKLKNMMILKKFIYILLPVSKFFNVDKSKHSCLNSAIMNSQR